MVTDTQLGPDGPAPDTGDANLDALIRRVRQHIVRMVFDAKSGHIGGSLSAVEIMSVLYTRVMRNDPQRPDWPERDRFVMSKGHATPVQYALLAELGYFPVEELSTFRARGTRLQGHSVLGKPPGVENSAGSLGMGLSFGLGMRLAARLGGSDTRVWVLMGDGEQNEGQVWEAAMAACPPRLSTASIALIDRNGIQNDDFTTLDDGHRAARSRSTPPFGWDVTSATSTGTTSSAVEAALRCTHATCRGQPACVIFDTVKGRGVSFMEHNPGFHGAPPSPGPVRGSDARTRRPRGRKRRSGGCLVTTTEAPAPAATREALGPTLIRLREEGHGPRRRRRRPRQLDLGDASSRWPLPGALLHASVRPSRT